MDNIFVMKFGKYKGYLITEVPNYYLKWCSENINDTSITLECLKELKDREENNEYVQSEFEIDYEELDMWDFDLINGG